MQFPTVRILLLHQFYICLMQSERNFGLAEIPARFSSRIFLEAWSVPRWFCAIDSQFLRRDSSRNRSVPRTRRRDTAETLRLIPESAALPLIFSSFSRSSSSPQSFPSPPPPPPFLPLLFLSILRLVFLLFTLSFLLFFSLHLFVGQPT